MEIIFFNDMVQRCLKKKKRCYFGIVSFKQYVFSSLCNLFNMFSTQQTLQRMCVLHRRNLIFKLVKYFRAVRLSGNAAEIPFRNSWRMKMSLGKLFVKLLWRVFFFLFSGNSKQSETNEFTVCTELVELDDESTVKAIFRRMC